jgi:hypothetical protein
MFMVCVACPVCRVFQAERGGAQHQQFVRQGAHPGQVADDRGLEPGHLGRVDVRLEPVPVDLGVAGRLVRTDLERLLQVRRGLRAFGVAVGLDAGRQPATPADGDGVPLLGPGRQREERPRLRAHPRPQVVRHAVAADQEETHALKRRVHFGGDGRASRLVAAEPRPQVDHWYGRGHAGSLRGVPVH